MQSEKIEPVNVAKTWKLVRRHRIYSRPITSYADISDATFLRLEFQNQASLMKVVDVLKLNPDRPEELEAAPLEWRKRLENYIIEVRDLGGILDRPGDYYFFDLAKDWDDGYECEIRNSPDADFWPDWLQVMADKMDLVDQAALAIWRERELFFYWPPKAELLWQGVTRHQAGYIYPEDIKCRLGREPDGRNNGPAIHAFELSGGERPAGWHIHHIYDGSVLIPGTSKHILHAVNAPDYFTHSGGLVAAHPAAHYIAHESELLGWLLRWEAFKRLQFDPDNIFGGCK